MNPKATFTVRPATAEDAIRIRALVWAVGINPTGLNWQRFKVANYGDGEIIGCGQIKPHGNGSRELASIAVWPAHRGMGVARAIIQCLLEENPAPIYLTCRASLQPFYEKFGFRVLSLEEMPPYFQRLSRAFSFFRPVFFRKEGLLVMGIEGKSTH